MNSEDSNNCATLPWLEQTRIKRFGCRVKILTLLGGMSPYTCKPYKFITNTIIRFKQQALVDYILQQLILLLSSYNMFDTKVPITEFKPIF